MDSKKEYEKALSTALSQKDENAVVALCEPMIWGFIHKYGFLYYFPSDIDDLLQEGRIAILNAMRSFDVKRGTKFGTYAYFAIKNDLHRYIRRNKMFDSMRLDIELDENAEASAHHESAYNMVSYIHDEIDNYNVDAHRQILALKFLQGYTNKEIEKMLKVSRKTIYRAVNTFIDKMRRKYLGINDYNNSERNNNDE